MNYLQARAYLDAHINSETGVVNDLPGTPIATLTARKQNPPSLDRFRRVLMYLGDPQLDLSILHITGTNGKGSTARMASELLASAAFTVGTYSSPDLGRVNERITINGVIISDEAFAEVVSAVARAEEAAGVECSYFELVTAAAFRYFADEAVEAAVIEVGAGGRWDCTNLGDGAVAVITNIELDHQEWFGPTKRDIAREKIGIVKPESVVVIGESDPDLVAYMTSEANRAGATSVLTVGVDFACDSNRTSIGGRLVALRTPTASYADIHIPLHGRFQGENAAVALTSVEAFLGETLPRSVVLEGFANVKHPGRLEVMDRNPLLIIDGAHNEAGAAAVAETMRDEFTANPERILVIGLLHGRDATAVLRNFDVASAKQVIVCPPPSQRAQPVEVVAAASRSLGALTTTAKNVEEAIMQARAVADDNDCILIAGSLYLVSEARRLLLAERR
jgi:dihydrofolate synthase / folylpolyglutamate synthase